MRLRLAALGLLLAPLGATQAVAQCGYGTSAQDCYHQQRDRQGAEQAEMAARQQQQSAYPEPQQIPQSDPMGARINAATALFELDKLKLERQSALLADPRYRAYRDGEWKFFGGETVLAGKGQFCSALFWNSQGVVVLSGPGGDYQGALLTFVHPDFPKPKQFQTVTVSLWQTGDKKPQNVKAFSYTQPGGAGAISLAVPTLDAALGTMLDRQGFRLRLGGKVILDLTWRDGHMARDQLRQCYAARRR